MDYQVEPEFLVKPDAAGKALMRKFRDSTASFHWGDLRGNSLNNGSTFLLYTGKALFAVTAGHVFRGYMERSMHEPLVCQIDGMPFNPAERLISAGSAEIDIATFAITEDEFNLLGKSTVPWPPIIPEAGNGVLVCGLPGLERRNPRPFFVDAGYSTLVMRVDSVSDRTLSMLRQTDEEIIDVLVYRFTK